MYKARLRDAGLPRSSIAMKTSYHIITNATLQRLIR